MPTHAGAPKDGRLNLEQQKKRAKELLAAFNAGDATAQQRLAAIASPKLADAQFVIARENGFASWPKLKAHCEALALARAAMSRAPDAATTLHIRCGTDIERTLRDAGFAGRFHEFSDPFCQGPVRDLPRARFIAERSAFIAGAYDMGRDEVDRRQAAAYDIFDELGDFTSIVLWFEHDSYDQLILAFILSELASKPNLPPVHLICTDDVPGVSRFIGLGQLSPEVIRWLWSSQRQLGSEHFAFGRKVWNAITNPDPRPLLALAAPTPPIPQMSRALKRHLMELPSTHNGLSHTQQLALETIAANDGAELRHLFAPHMNSEPLPFLGDTMFADILEQMAQAGDAPLVLSLSPDPWRRTATLTATGYALLANQRDWLSCTPPPRWVGGVETKPGQPNWRFDQETKSVVQR